MQGAYALVLENKEEHQLAPGSLEEKTFKRGRYIYVGSAFGKNQSISNRVNRHAELYFSGKGRVHWHIDYLLTSSKFKLIGFNEFPSKERNECKVAREIKRKSMNSVKGFGSTDCDCESHLFYQGCV